MRARIGRHRSNRNRKRFGVWRLLFGVTVFCGRLRFAGPVAVSVAVSGRAIPDSLARYSVTPIFLSRF